MTQTQPVEHPTTPQNTTSHAESPALDVIDAEIARRQREIDDLLAKKEQEQAAQLNERFKAIDVCKTALGVTTDKELIMLIRNRGLKSAKAKRLPESSLKFMYYVLKNGATAPATAKALKVALATVHSRKKEWGLTHRAGVKPKTFAEASRGFNPDKVVMPEKKARAAAGSGKKRGG